MLQLNHLFNMVKQFISKRIRVLGDEIGAIIFQIGRDAFCIAISLDDTLDSFVGNFFTDIILIIGAEDESAIATITSVLFHNRLCRCS